MIDFFRRLYLRLLGFKLCPSCKQIMDEVEIGVDYICICHKCKPFKSNHHMKYRIKELTNSATGAKKYISQYRILFLWRTCSRHLGWDVYAPAEFDNRADAEVHIKEMEIDAAWKPTYDITMKGKTKLKAQTILLIIVASVVLSWVNTWYGLPVIGIAVGAGYVIGSTSKSKPKHF